MPRTRRAFTDEFKREAVKLVKQPGAKVTHIARDLGIEQSVLRRWVSQEHGGVLDMRPNKPLRSESASEVERLQRELRRVTTERDILKNGHRTRRTAPLKRNTCRPKLRTVRLAVTDSFLEASNPVKKPGPGEAADPAVVAPSCDPV